ncbi:transposase family protein [Microcoleus sp. ZQ-A2]|nr:DDE-type integrase/transposase/recombinase [Microcoleus sp. FACHB-1]
MFTEDTMLEHSSSSQEAEPLQRGQAKPLTLLNEITPEVQQKIDLIDAVLQAHDRKSRSEAIQKASEVLGRTPRMIRIMVKRVEHEGVATLGVGRKDKGQFRISEQWFKFIIAIHSWGQRDGSRMNHNQVHVHLMTLASKGEALREKKYTERFKDYPEVLSDLVAGKYPSHPTVYKVIYFHLTQKNKKVRHPGSPAEGQIIQTTEGILEITESNQIWQCDHTKLDIFLVDDQGEVIFQLDDKGEEVIGRPYITLIMDSYSGCVAGFHVGFEAAGSHEVGLALRHAILPKQYGPEYELDKQWNVCGVPEYWVTDRAKEFKSNHLKQISMQLDFKRRLRAFPSAGGLIESIFDKINKEVLSILPGYTGSSVEKRPDNCEKHASLTLNELEKILVRYFVDHYNQHDYPRVANQKRTQRWQSGLLIEPEVVNERELDICLMKVAHRKVEKYGCVRFEGLVYRADCLMDYQGEPISLRYDQRNILVLLAYTRPKDGQPGEFIGVVPARDAKEKQMSLEELKWRKQKLREQTKEIDNSSILNERLDLYEFVDQKRKSKRQRRKKAQQRHEQQTNQSKVLELFPQNATVDDTQVPAVVSESTVEQVHPIDDSPNEYIPPIKIVAYDWNQLMEENW